MKRIISLFLVVLMLAAMVIVPASAEPAAERKTGIWYKDTFDTNEINEQFWIKEGTLFYQEGGKLYAPAGGVVHQSQATDFAKFKEFNACVDVKIAEMKADGSGKVGLWYNSGSGTYNLWFNGQTGEFELEGAGKTYKPETPFKVGEDGDVVNIGLHVVPGKISAYVNGVEVITHENPSIGNVESQILLWNQSEYSEWDNFTVASPNYEIFGLDRGNGIWYKDTFDTDEINEQFWIKEGTLFYQEGGKLYAPAGGVVHQSKATDFAKFREFNASVDVKIAEMKADGSGKVGLWYNSGSGTYNLWFNGQTGEFELEGAGKTYKPETPFKVGEDGEFVKIGLHVELGKIAAYVNGVEVITHENPNIGCVKSQILLWNQSEYSEWDNFTMASPNYDIFGLDKGNGIWYKDTFDTDEINEQFWIKEGTLFYQEGGKLYAPAGGVVHQSKATDFAKFREFNASVDVKIAEMKADGSGKVGLWYNSGSGTYNLWFNGQTGEFELEGAGKTYKPETPFKVGEDGEFVKIGLHVVPGKITAYVNGVEVIVHENPNIGCSRSQILLWNQSGCSEWDNFTMASPDYDIFGLDKGDGIWYEDKFDTNEINEQFWIKEGTMFYQEDGKLMSPSDAVVHQSKFGDFSRFKEFNVSVDVKIAEMKADGSGKAGLWYNSGSKTYTLYFNGQTGEFELNGALDDQGKTKTYKPEKATAVGEKGEFVNIGLHVEDGKIIAYVNGEEAIVHEEAGIGYWRSQILLWNHANCSEWDNFVIASNNTDVFKAAIVYGDVNGDGKVDTDDVILLVQNQAGWESAKNVGAGADANGDGKVDTDDVILLVQNQAGWSSAVLGPQK